MEGMLAEEIALQEEKEGQHEMKKRQIMEEIERHEKETQEEEMRDAEEDELCWQQHIAATVQEEEDQALRMEMDRPGKRKKVTVETTLMTQHGRIVGQQKHSATVDASEKVKVQVEFLPEQAAEEEEDDNNDEQVAEELEMEQAAVDEEVMQLAREEIPESEGWRLDRLRKNWFALWRSGHIKDDQVEKRWKLEGLMEFEAELPAQMVEARASQQAETQMSQRQSLATEEVDNNLENVEEAMVPAEPVAAAGPAVEGTVEDTGFNSCGNVGPAEGLDGEVQGAVPEDVVPVEHDQDQDQQRRPRQAGHGARNDPGEARQHREQDE